MQQVITDSHCPICQKHARHPAISGAVSPAQCLGRSRVFFAAKVGGARLADRAMHRLPRRFSASLPDARADRRVLCRAAGTQRLRDGALRQYARGQASGLARFRRQIGRDCAAGRAVCWRSVALRVGCFRRRATGVGRSRASRPRPNFRNTPAKRWDCRCNAEPSIFSKRTGPPNLLIPS